VDKLTPAERSAHMARVHGVDTRPEMAVRRMVHAMGFRYRLHAADLPGKPDLVFRRLEKIVFVHGCFWHGHSCRAGRNRPSSGQNYWIAKLERNVTRDRAHVRKLRRAGWSVMTVWECQLKKPERVAARLFKFLAN
jgi:DNA mismatch endonuclease (patch repair protein)